MASSLGQTMSATAGSRAKSFVGRTFGYFDFFDDEALFVELVIVDGVSTGGLHDIDDRTSGVFAGELKPHQSALKRHVFDQRRDEAHLAGRDSDIVATARYFHKVPPRFEIGNRESEIGDE